MNWRLSALDPITLIFNSDAIRRTIGREANAFDCALDYGEITGASGGRIERSFSSRSNFPEEGKYHYDGHRDCGVIFSPSETRPTVPSALSAGKD